jgi:hypothetical protein
MRGRMGGRRVDDGRPGNCGDSRDRLTGDSHFE